MDPVSESDPTVEITRPRSNRGFSRVETLVGAAVVAVVATIAVPSYADSVRRGRVAEVRAELAGFGVRMEQSYRDHGGYGKESCAAALPASPHFVFSCALSNGGQNFRGAATGRQRMAGYAYSIDDLGHLTADAVPGGTSVVATR